MISLQLTAGEIKQNQDFEDEYQPPADISGVVFSDLSGNGIQDGGEAGLAGVTVDLYLDVNNNDAVESGDTLLGNGRTDVSGNYVFVNKPAGNYLVKVSDTDAVLTNYVGTTSDPHDVTLAGSDYSQAHFGFQPPTASIGDLVWLDSNANGIFDSGTETGISGVTVDLYRDGNKNGAIDGWDALVDATVTDSAGGYDFTELPAGNYLVKVTDLNGVLDGLGRSGGTDPHVHILAHNEDYDDADFGFVASPLAKRVDRSGATPGDILTYTLTPSYSGNAPLTDLTITDNVPDGTVYVGGSASPPLTSGPDPLSWNLGSHAAADQGYREASGLGSGAELSVFAFRGDDKTDFWKYSPEDDVWSVLASAPDTVKEGGALVTDNDDRIWGLRGDDAMDFWLYTVSTDTWTILASTPEKVKHGGALAYDGTDVYALRGDGKADFWRYDIAADAWTILAPFPDGEKSGVKEGGSLTAFGSAIYGLRGDGTKELYRYDPGTDSWTLLAETAENVKKGGSLSTDREDIYALRGDGKQDFYRYDVGSNSWTILAETPDKVNEGGALAYSGAGFFAFQGNEPIFWHYDIDTNAWTSLASTPEKVKWGGALAVITSATTLTVDMAASPSVVTESGSVSVVLTATASEEVLGFAAPALSVVEVDGATAVLDFGPAPATADLAPDVPMDFTYTYTVDAGASPGSVRFSTPDFTTGEKSWPEATSNSVLVTPPLSFQVEIDDATTLPLVSNVAAIADSSGALPFTESTPANTVLTKADIAGQIRFDLDGDGDPADLDPGIFGATVELYSDLDGDQDATGETLIASVVTGSQGNYDFGDVPRGRYVIVASDRPGTSSTYDTQGSPTDNQIALTAIVDSAGHDFLDANFSKPDSWNAWEAEFNSVLGAQNQPDQNPDGDIYDNLLEYALCLHPGTGLPGPGGFHLEVTNDHVDAVFFRARGGLADITYLFQGRSELPIEEIEAWQNLISIPGRGVPPSGVTVTDLGNGIEEVRLTQVDLLEPLTSSNGFVRLEVQLNTGSITGTGYTQVFGWSEVTIETSRFQTYSNPLLKHETLSGTIDAIWGTHSVLVTTSLGDADLGKVLNLGKSSYYIEIIDGDLTGHRFDISATGVGSMGLAADEDPLAGPPFNTMDTAASIPSELAGDQFVLREHFTLDQYFPPQSPFTARQTSLDEENPPDRIFFFDGGWEVYWLFNNSDSSGVPFWDLDGNASFIDAGKRVIPPQEGMFLHIEGQPITFLNIGIVRKNDFIVPLKQGYNLIAGGFPMDQSPAVRGMSPSIFEGDPDPALADSIFTWLGDTAEPEDNYQAYFLLENAGTTTPRWSYWDDPTLTPRDWDITVFPRNRSSFVFRVHNPLDDYVMYLPWCVGLIGE